MHKFPRDPARRMWWTEWVSRDPNKDRWNPHNNNAFLCDVSIISSVLCDIFIYLSEDIWWHWRNEVMMQYSGPDSVICQRRPSKKK